MVTTFLEYRRVKRGTRVERETTDYVAKEETSDTRIIPDAAFILENIESGKRALFFLEMDMGTERIVSQITRDKRISLFYKLTQYDRYLQSLRYRHTYAAFGDFRFFTLLFITIGEERIENIRREMERLPRVFGLLPPDNVRAGNGGFLQPDLEIAPADQTPELTGWSGRPLRRRQYNAASVGTRAKRQGFQPVGKI